MTRSAVCATFLALSLSTGLSPPPAPAQEPALEESGLQQEVARLNGIMKEIAGLLLQQVEGQETDLLLRRSELANRGLGPAKERLQEARAELNGLEDEERNLAMMQEMFEAQKAELRGVGESPEEEQVGVQLEQIEERLEVVETRKRELRREMTELENGVQSREQDLRLLEELIDARLGLR